jgi:hypothetical protein
MKGHADPQRFSTMPAGEGWTAKPGGAPGKSARGRLPSTTQGL